MLPGPIGLIVTGSLSFLKAASSNKQDESGKECYSRKGGKKTRPVEVREFRDKISVGAGNSGEVET